MSDHKAVGTAILGEDKLGDDGDDFYQSLMEAHEPLSPDQSVRMNARLVLLMANQIGDIDLLRLILKAASESGTQRDRSDGEPEPNE